MKNIIIITFFMLLLSSIAQAQIQPIPPTEIKGNLLEVEQKLKNNGWENSLPNDIKTILNSTDDD